MLLNLLLLHSTSSSSHLTCFKEEGEVDLRDWLGKVLWSSFPFPMVDGEVEEEDGDKLDILGETSGYFQLDKVMIKWAPLWGKLTFNCNYF